MNTSSKNQDKKLRVAFCHPDLGLGGAERLVVDAAVEMAKHGHEVDIYTTYYDPNRCFEETRSGAFAIRVHGNWFPRSIFGRFIALCAYIRCILLSLRLAWDSRRSPHQYDVVFADQVSVVIPIIKWHTTARVLFYCHFPDLLLASHTSTIQSLYRAPLDFIEQATTGMADMVVVNSAFTQNIFLETFPLLAQRGMVPQVLHPAVHPPDSAELRHAKDHWKDMLPQKVVTLMQDGPAFVSINRFERKKGIPLAVEALHCILTKNQGKQKEALLASSNSSKDDNKTKNSTGDKNKNNNKQKQPTLIIAGGYDVRLRENVEHLREIGRLAAGLGIRESVALLPSFTDEQRQALLAGCLAVVYTPPDEHFGIVPLEAMAAGVPVIACNSGGPLESVVDGETGLLRSPEPEEFAGAMEKLMEKGVAEKMGEKARNHVEMKFSRGAFGAKLNRILLDLAEKPSKGVGRTKKNV